MNRVWRAWMVLASLAITLTLSCASETAFAVTTTTVQGTLYRADGTPASGTVLISWNAFTTAGSESIAGGSMSLTVGSNGYVSVNLAPNQGAIPAGSYYTVVTHLTEGTVTREYWLVPSTRTADIAAVRAQVLPASLAVQAVSKQYVDAAIENVANTGLAANGGILTGPLTLSADPTTTLQAATKHYVDEVSDSLVAKTGSNMNGALTTPSINNVTSPQNMTLQEAVNAVASGGSVQIPANYTGSDTFTNPNGVYVQDMRTSSGGQQLARSVKEWGAKCDGNTNDTAAIQAALDYAYNKHVALTLPSGVCLAHRLHWRGQSISGMSKQISALQGYPGEDVLSTDPDDANVMQYTHLHDFTIYVDASVDASCSPAKGRASAGNCTYSRPVENDSIFSPKGDPFSAAKGSGAAWYVGNCALAMPAVAGSGNGLLNAEVKNLLIKAVGNDPLSAYYQAKSSHTCGLYMQAWPYNAHFESLQGYGLGSGVVIAAPSNGVVVNASADGNTWKDLIFLAVHPFTTIIGAHNVIDEAQFYATNSAATGEPPTGLVLDFYGLAVGWSVRNAYVEPGWYHIDPTLNVVTSADAVSAINLGSEHGLGFTGYGSQIDISFTNGCTAQAKANVASDGSIASVTVLSGGSNCGNTVANVSAGGNTNPYYPFNLIKGLDMTFFGGNIGQGAGVYTVWDAIQSQSYGTNYGGGGTRLDGTSYESLLIGDGLGAAGDGSTNYTGYSNALYQAGATVKDQGLNNTVVNSAGTTGRNVSVGRPREIAHTLKPDFLMLGALTGKSFSSLDDLFFTAEDFLWENTQQGVGTSVTKDTAAPMTQTYVTAPPPGSWSLQRVDGSLGTLVLGDTFPTGSGTLYIAAKASTTSSQMIELYGSLPGIGPCMFASQNVGLGTTWNIYSITYSTITGNPTCDDSALLVQVSAGAPTVSTAVQVAWIAFVPSSAPVQLSSDPVGKMQTATAQYVDCTSPSKHQVDPTCYGAKGDGLWMPDNQPASILWATMTEGSKAFTTNAVLTQADIGKLVVINEAGGANTQLTASIASVTSAHSGELSVAASVAVSQAALAYGTDDTAAIEAAWEVAKAKNWPLVFPPGGFFYNGSGLSGWLSPSLKGSNRQQSGIIVGAGKKLLLQQGDIWSSLSVHDLTFHGGKGYLWQINSTANQDAGHYEVSGNVFEQYTSAAISTESLDNPYWLITHNEFMGENSTTTMGVALGGANDTSTIRDNAFLEYRYGVKFRGCQSVTIDSNEFIQYGNTSPGLMRAGLWFAARQVNSALGSHHCKVINNKFGDGVQDPSDVVALFAMEDTTSGSYNGDRMSSTSEDIQQDFGLEFFRNNYNPTTPNPFIYSYTQDLRGFKISDIYTMTAVGNLIQFAPGISPQFERSHDNICGPIVYPDAFPDSKRFNTGASNSVYGCTVVDDPTGKIPYSNYSQKMPWELGVNVGSYWKADIQALPHWTATGNATVTAINGPDGGSNAARIQLQDAAATVHSAIAYPSAIMADMPMWLEFDVKPDETNGDPAAGTVAQAGDSNLNAMSYQMVQIPPVSYTGWKHYVVRIDQKNLTGAVSVQFGARGDAGLIGTFDVANIALYQSTAPQPGSQFTKNIYVDSGSYCNNTGGKSICWSVGEGAPSSSCSAVGYGGLYSRTDTGDTYTCKSDGAWHLLGGQLSGTTSPMGGSALAPGGCMSGTASVVGAQVGMAAIAGTYPGDGFTVNALVTDSNTVTVHVCALVTATPVSQPYMVKVIP